MDSLAVADVSLPVLLLGKSAYKYPLTQNMKKIAEGKKLFDEACMSVVKERKEAFSKQS